MCVSTETAAVCLCQISSYLKGQLCCFVAPLHGGVIAFFFFFFFFANFCENLQVKNVLVNKENCLCPPVYPHAGLTGWWQWYDRGPAQAFLHTTWLTVSCIPSSLYSTHSHYMQHEESLLLALSSAVTRRLRWWRWRWLGGAFYAPLYFLCVCKQ